VNLKRTTWGQIRQMMWSTVACYIWIAAALWLPGYAVATETPVVAAASSLNPALTEVVRAFTDKTGKSVRLSFGSSGNIARQIAQGAPFELFLSADERYVRALVDQSLTLDAGSVYANGRLVLYVPGNSLIQADTELRDLKRALADGRLRRLAIANPEHAPYGVAARQLLKRLDIWHRLKGRLVLGENVSQAAQFAATGSVDAGIFSASTARLPAVSLRGKSVTLAEHLHDPIRHRMVLLKSAGQTAREFYTFMDGPVARQILNKYEFTNPLDRP